MFKVALSQEKHKSIVRSEKMIEVHAIWGFLQSVGEIVLRGVIELPFPSIFIF